MNVTIRTYADGALVGTRTLNVPDPTPEQVNRTTIQTAIADALATNATIKADADTYLAIASPTNAQVAAQVRALTTAAKIAATQRNGIIRLVVGDYTGTD